MIARLHYITQDMPGKTHVQLVQEACVHGARWVQLRLKNRGEAECKLVALQALDICRKHGAKLIINDHSHLAKEIGAHGMHLGKEDMSTALARKEFGNDFIIGGTANTFEDIKMHVAAGVDYIGLGPFRHTVTKAKLSPVLGLEGYKRIMEQCAKEHMQIPVIAIGGIIPGDVSGLMEAGLHGIAVAGYVNYAQNKAEAVQQFLSVLEPVSKK